MRGFTVDDALIPVRYAHHLALGVGYRFNADGPVTDGVTPLPWSFLLVPVAVVARGDALRTLSWAKAFGAVAWLVAAFALGVACARACGPGRRARVGTACGFVVLGLSFPIGAWSVSGLETGLATMLATFAAIFAVSPHRRPTQVVRAAVVAGLAATLRPELVVWAVVLSMAAVVSIRRERRQEPLEGREGARLAMHVLGVTALASGPFVLCALVRWAVFGRPAPLSVIAKPSDLAHGFPYAMAASVVVLLPLLAFAPLALRRCRAWILVVAFVAHGTAVAVAGGDWMPYARLLVPVAPSLLLAYAESTKLARTWSVVLRLGLASTLGGWLAWKTAPAGMHVQSDREALVVLARPVLRDAHVVAALDVGWVSAATDATIVDLAGLTDRDIAVLPGGHTSKRVSSTLLDERHVDAVLVYSDERAVEARLLSSPTFSMHFTHTADLPLGDRGASYAVFRRTR